MVSSRNLILPSLTISWAGLLYVAFFFGGISINKYVLSILGFKYPTIFQVRLFVFGLWNSKLGLSYDTECASYLYINCKVGLMA
jgi:hypothetical protein